MKLHTYPADFFGQGKSSLFHAWLAPRGWFDSV
jgi:hypothetical protein